MISDPTMSVALSSLGWIDHGSVWRFETQKERPSVIPLSDAKYLRLHQGQGQEFAVEHHWSGERVRLSAHSYVDPERAVSTIDVNGWTARVEGEDAAWSSLPKAYVGYLNDDATGAAGYFSIVLGDSGVVVDRLDWFDEGYDHAYQAVVSVVQPSKSDELLFGVQRSSELVLFDHREKRVTRRVPLADRHGGPHPVVSMKSPAVWVTDYDTVVRLDRTGWSVERTALLQPAPTGTQMFVGDVWVPPDESYLLIPRPGSGDVVRIDATDLSLIDRADLGQQPLVAVVLHDNVVVARDWKSGDVLTGTLPGAPPQPRR